MTPLQQPGLAAPSAGPSLSHVPSLPLGHMAAPGLLSSAAVQPVFPNSGLQGPLLPCPSELAPPILFQVAPISTVKVLVPCGPHRRLVGLCASASFQPLLKA